MCSHIQKYGVLKAVAWWGYVHKQDLGIHIKQLHLGCYQHISCDYCHALEEIANGNDNVLYISTEPSIIKTSIYEELQELVRLHSHLSGPKTLKNRFELLEIE